MPLYNAKKPVHIQVGRGVDVAIASRILSRALSTSESSRVQKIIVIAGDTDFAPALEEAERVLGRGNVLVVGSKECIAAELKKYSALKSPSEDIIYLEDLFDPPGNLLGKKHKLETSVGTSRVLINDHKVLRGNDHTHIGSHRVATKHRYRNCVYLSETVVIIDDSSNSDSELMNFAISATSFSNAVSHSTDLKKEAVSLESSSDSTVISGYSLERNGSTSKGLTRPQNFLKRLLKNDKPRNVSDTFISEVPILDSTAIQKDGTIGYPNTAIPVELVNSPDGIQTNAIISYSTCKKLGHAYNLYSEKSDQNNIDDKINLNQNFE